MLLLALAALDAGKAGQSATQSGQLAGQLSGQTTARQASEIAAQVGHDELDAWEVSRAVNSPSNDDPENIRPS